MTDNDSKRQCPKCGGKSWKAGKIVTSRSGVKQRYVCTACGHIFLVAVSSVPTNNNSNDNNER